MEIGWGSLLPPRDVWLPCPLPFVYYLTAESGQTTGPAACLSSPLKQQVHGSVLTTLCCYQVTPLCMPWKCLRTVITLIAFGLALVCVVLEFDIQICHCCSGGSHWEIVNWKLRGCYYNANVRLLIWQLNDILVLIKLATFKDRPTFRFFRFRS